MGAAFGAAPHLSHSRFESVCEAVYLFFRGTPIMVQLFIVFYGIPALTALAGIDTSKMDPLYAAIATYALSSAARAAEIMRGGVNSVDRGQAEAAFSIGLNGGRHSGASFCRRRLCRPFPTSEIW
ncbi:ABC transporter permease subunit [Bacillus amyloliquefaciens]|nr:ABC transporter permease subunit [Bacillus amyloliquefaciens]